MRPSRPFGRRLHGLPVHAVRNAPPLDEIRKKIQEAVNRVIAPDRYLEGADGLVGMNGEVKEVEEKKMVMIEGDLWPVESAQELRAEQKVKVVKAKDGILTVEQIEREA